MQNGKVIIPCSESFQALKLEEAAQKIGSVVAETTGQNLAVEVQKPQKQENAGAAAGRPAVSPAVEMVKNVFKGEIV